MNQIYDETGIPKQLGELLGRGGEAEVYPLEDRPDILFKKYHDSVLQKRREILINKIDVMKRLGQESELGKSKNLSWPLIHVYDNQKNWIGYAMYRADGVTMFHLAHAMAYKKHFPDLDRIKIVAYLINLLKEVKKLHNHGIMLGDYNLQNILLDPRSDKVTLIDCDSYQIRYKDKFYACEVGTPDMTPKEHQNTPYKDLVRTLESEYFSIAIILFKALMLGRHPYDVVGGTDPVQNLCNGKFPYGKDGRGIPKGVWFNIWSHMPYKLKSHFIQTFTEGANNPQKRTDIDTWLRELNIYLQEMRKGWHALEIRPDRPKVSDYKGNKTIEGKQS